MLTGTLAPGWDITKVNGGQPADKICTLGTITKFGGETGCYNHETLFVDDETLPTSKRVCSIATTPILLDPTKDARLNLACPTGYYCPLTGIVIKYFSLYSVYVQCKSFAKLTFLLYYCPLTAPAVVPTVATRRRRLLVAAENEPPEPVACPVNSVCPPGVSAPTSLKIGECALSEPPPSSSSGGGSTIAPLFRPSVSAKCGVPGTERINKQTLDPFDVRPFSVKVTNPSVDVGVIIVKHWVETISTVKKGEAGNTTQNPPCYSDPGSDKELSRPLPTWLQQVRFDNTDVSGDASRTILWIPPRSKAPHGVDLKFDVVASDLLKLDGVLHRWCFVGTHSRFVDIDGNVAKADAMVDLLDEGGSGSPQQVRSMVNFSLDLDISVAPNAKLFVCPSEFKLGPTRTDATGTTSGGLDSSAAPSKIFTGEMTLGNNDVDRNEVYWNTTVVDAVSRKSGGADTAWIQMRATHGVSSPTGGVSVVNFTIDTSHPFLIAKTEPPTPTSGDNSSSSSSSESDEGITVEAVILFQTWTLDASTGERGEVLVKEVRVSIIPLAGTMSATHSLVDAGGTTEEVETILRGMYNEGNRYRRVRVIPRDIHGVRLVKEEGPFDIHSVMNITGGNLMERKKDYIILTPPNFKNTFDIKFAHPGHYEVRVADKAAKTVGRTLVIDVDPIECNRTLGEETSKTDPFVCSCGVGLYLTDRGKCKQCGDGKFANELNDECLACPKGSATAAAKVGLLHANISDCACNEPEKTFLRTMTPFAGLCACRAGYKKGRSAATTPTANLTQAAVESLCEPCDADSFSADGDQSCISCGTHLVLKRGAQWRLPGNGSAAGVLSETSLAAGGGVNFSSLLSGAAWRTRVENCGSMPNLECHPCECDTGYYLAPKIRVTALLPQHHTIATVLFSLPRSVKATSYYCRACPQNGDCPRGTRGIENVRVKPGHWRATPYSSSIYKCAIPGDNVGRANLLTNCLGGEYSTCAPVFPVDAVAALETAGEKFKYSEVFQRLAGPSLYGGGNPGAPATGTTGTVADGGSGGGGESTVSSAATPSSGSTGAGMFSLFDDPRKAALWQQCSAVPDANAVSRTDSATQAFARSWQCSPFGPLAVLPLTQQQQPYTTETKEAATDLILRAATHAFQCVGAELSQTVWTDDELATHPCTRHRANADEHVGVSGPRTPSMMAGAPAAELRGLLLGTVQQQEQRKQQQEHHLIRSENNGDGNASAVNGRFKSGGFNDNGTSPGLSYQGVLCGVCPGGAGLGVDGRSCHLCLDTQDNNGFVALVGVVGVFGLMVIVWLQLRTMQEAERKKISMDERSLGQVCYYILQSIFSLYSVYIQCEGFAKLTFDLYSMDERSMGQLRYDQYINGTKTGMPPDQAEAVVVLFRIAMSYTQVVSFIIGVESIEWPDMVTSVVASSGQYTVWSFQFASTNCMIQQMMDASTKVREP